MNKKTENLIYEAQNVRFLTHNYVEQQVLPGTIRDLSQNLPVVAL
jgi:hypothetical protein